MEEKEKQGSENTTLYYGIGAAIVVILVAGVYMLRQKPSLQTIIPTTQTAVETPLIRPTGPITGLACELQYYNPVIGLKQYYLSVDGADVSAAKTVDCDFTMSVAGKTVGKASVKGTPLTNEPSRGGKTFRCVTEAVDLEPSVPTVIDVALSDDQKNTATCSSTFLFPAP